MMSLMDAIRVIIGMRDVKRSKRNIISETIDDSEKTIEVCIKEDDTN